MMNLCDKHDDLESEHVGLSGCSRQAAAGQRGYKKDAVKMQVEQVEI